MLYYIGLFDLAMHTYNMNLKKMAESKEEGKYQESIQSSFTPNIGHHIGK